MAELLYQVNCTNGGQPMMWVPGGYVLELSDGDYRVFFRKNEPKPNITLSREAVLSCGGFTEAIQKALDEAGHKIF